MIRESQIEKYLCKRVSEIGGAVRKLMWIGRNAAPDRLVMHNGAHFVEIKRPGAVVRPSQMREHRFMTSHKLKVYVISSYEDVDIFISRIT